MFLLGWWNEIFICNRFLGIFKGLGMKIKLVECLFVCRIFWGMFFIVNLVWLYFIVKWYEKNFFFCGVLNKVINIKLFKFFFL